MNFLLQGLIQDLFLMPLSSTNIIQTDIIFILCFYSSSFIFTIVLISYDVATGVHVIKSLVNQL